MRDPFAAFTDDLLVEIVSRVPYKSLCRCECVAKRWRDLISHPDHCKRLPQTLAGFFCENAGELQFTKVSGERRPLAGLSLSFLPNWKSLQMLDSCNGLILCRYRYPRTEDYVVCNPATEKWVDVPCSRWSGERLVIARLAFDPAMSSHFHVFEFIPDYAWEVEEEGHDGRIEGVNIYSSRTRDWKHKYQGWGSESGSESDSEWDDRIFIDSDAKGVSFNGMLHLPSHYDIVAVDVEGNTWERMPNPRSPYFDDAFSNGIHLSRGQLYFTDTDGSNGSELSVWVHNRREKWTLKHNVSHSQLFGAEYLLLRDDFSVISIHPEHNLIFMVCGPNKTLMSYEMGQMKLSLIHQIGSKFRDPYLPYVPLFSDSLADGH